ncbi:SMP-30/gluconolactonase/LRE family protein [Paraburkholderia caballeronis]|uniref:SMP-30/gluconolactonase/LRE family protein n=1 Tax=Paraburkholderia caballeronis TaxID=416943 RepID=UPI00106556C0|nr:SMP-30/gluconolactonase/LRE family protein [Paraburkholderia caballeronis]TDV16426.1 xylono-1,4-lactonase [Paraburkholderia caballeronis]TDV18822.1 xylono-1,4-lactonase [Paraburkholderia caballeronis]TDV26955.1 xylono-1,4-lactonase [Paraburkholderia caballeronis]
MNTIAPVCEWPVEATLGEGPVWHAAERAVYFVDIKSRRVHRLSVDTGERRTWDAPAQPGFVLPLDDGAFVCGLQGGLHRFTPADGTFSMVLPVEADRPGNRLNDGYVDAQGRLWFGSMDDAEEAPDGVLYRVDTNGALVAQDRDYVITNGPAASPDGRTLYHVDTLRRVIYAFDLAADGELSGRRVFAAIAGTGYPDGLTVDADGFVWIALFGGARIERYAPDGTLVGHVAFPCPNVTKLAFGGDDLRTVYATTARKGLDADALARAPLAGALFSFRAPVAGQEQQRCRVAFRV